VTAHIGIETIESAAIAAIAALVGWYAGRLWERWRQRGV
jgi:hypothetical protein